jgi:twitching motility protein PilT
MQRRSGTLKAGRLWLGDGADGDIHALLRAAREAGATDVHVTAHAPVHFRVGGELRPVDGTALAASEARRLACALLSDAQVAALDDRADLDFMCADADQHRYRVNVGYFNGTVGAVIRLLPPAPRPLETLGLPPVVEAMTHRRKGLILVTGSTSQGKTTTLASMVDAINRRSRRHVITIEDPIEYLHTNKLSVVRQREVGRDTRSFESGLRAALRQDPDVLMIGEMRDYETIETALRAAETGVLVLSTLHIVSIEKLMERLASHAPPGREPLVRLMTAETLLCVIHQELLATTDGGKRVATEILVGTRAARNLLKSPSGASQLRMALLSGRDVGMVTMNASLDQLLAEGLITEGMHQDVLLNYALPGTETG